MKMSLRRIMLFTASLCILGVSNAQNTEVLSAVSADSKMSEISPNADKEKGVLIYATTLRDYFKKERGWYSMYSNDVYNFNKIKTWKPGSEKHTDGLLCGAWGGDSYYAYYDQAFDLGLDYPHAFVKVDVETGDTTNIVQFVEKPGHPTEETYEYWNPRKLYCMTYNPVKKVMYALGRTVMEDKSQVSSLYTVNMKTGEADKIKDLDFISYSMAVDMAGNLWMQQDIYENSVLRGCKLNLVDTENFTIVETKELSLQDGGMLKGSYYGSMAFDYRTGDLYWTTVTNPSSSINSVIYKIDMHTGKVKHVGQLYGTFIGLYIPYEVPESSEAPRPVTDLTATPGDNGALTSTLKWVNPVEKWNTKKLENLSEIRIYKGNMSQDFVTVKASAENVGKEMTWTDENAKNGINTYYVVPVSDGVLGFSDSIKVFVGKDIPGEVTNIMVENNNNEVTLTWDAPAVGENGGYVAPDELTYTVVRNPDGKEIAKDIKERKITDNDFEVIGTYSYKIKAKNSIGEGVETESGFITAGTNFTVPVDWQLGEYENSLLWTPQGGWSWTSLFGEGQMFITMNEYTSDNYLYSPAIKFEAGKKYRIRSTIKTFYGPKCVYKFAITMGNDKTPEAQNIVLRKEESYSPEQNYYVDELVDYFTPTEEGIYYYAINLTQIIGRDDFSLFGVKIDEMTPVDLSADKLDIFEAIKGEGNKVDVTITNKGFQAAKDYKVKIARKEGEEYVVLGELTDVPEIPAEATKVVEVTYKVDVDGGVELCAIVESEQDGNDDNNISPVYMVPVSPEGTLPFNKKFIDEETDKVETLFPMAFTSNRSISQSIYLAENLGDKDFTLSRLAYTYENNGTTYVLGPVNVKIYMNYTDKEFYSEKDSIVAPSNDDNLLYSGDISIDPEGKRLVFDLDKSFEYKAGKNVCITMVKEGSVGIEYPLLFNSVPTGDDYRTLTLHDGLTGSVNVPEIYMAVEYTGTGISDEISLSENTIWYNSDSSCIMFGNDSAKHVLVYDMDGTVLFDSELGEGESILPVQLSNGIYIVRTITLDGSVENSKILVK